MSNLEIRKFHQTIKSFVDEFELPAEVKRICIKDILNDLENVANNEIRAEIERGEEDGN